MAKIDLNSASERELTTIEGIDGHRAGYIMAARRDRGRFSSWEDVGQIDGIDSVLMKKLQASATLGSAGDSTQSKSRSRSSNGKDRGADGSRAQGSRSSQASPGSTSGGSETDASDSGGEDDELEILADALSGLAQMDREAAVAYEIAAEMLEDLPAVSETLARFADDHRRHVANLEGVLEELGFDLGPDTAEPESSTFAALAAAMSELGDRPALLALLANERFTNATYENAAELAVDDEIRALLEQHLADEQRHVRWLSQHRDANLETIGAAAT